jgi:hypothetical protein
MRALSFDFSSRFNTTSPQALRCLIAQQGALPWMQ